MLETVDTLIHENYEKQLLLKDTKYKMLRAQINPHFLYNTLNVIHWMIRLREMKRPADDSGAWRYITLFVFADSLCHNFGRKLKW